MKNAYTAYAQRGTDILDGVIDWDYESILDFCSMFVDNTIIITVYKKKGKNLIYVCEYYVGEGWHYLDQPVE